MVHADEAYVGFETCFDLETGTVVQDPLDPSFCPPEADISFGFNSDRENPTVLSWNEQYVDVALLKGVPVSAVGPGLLDDNLLYADYIGDPNYPLDVDVPFGASDSAIVKTGDGNLYAVGHAVCEITAESLGGYTSCIPTSDVNRFGVRFYYELRGDTGGKIKNPKK
jgi:hypothetical protein